MPETKPYSEMTQQELQYHFDIKSDQYRKIIREAQNLNEDLLEIKILLRQVKINYE